MLFYLFENLINTLTGCIRKVHCHCKSRCCWDCMEISTNVFQRSNTKYDINKL